MDASQWTTEFCALHQYPKTFPDLLHELLKKSRCRWEFSMSSTMIQGGGEAKQRPEAQQEMYYFLYSLQLHHYWPQRVCFLTALKEAPFWNGFELKNHKGWKDY